jgi:hypothetical protein
MNLSDYKRVCKYGCNTQLGQFDTKQNKYLETDGTLHTKERCESLKPKQEPCANLGQGQQQQESLNIQPQDREAKIAHVIKMIESIIPELEALK